MRAVYYDHQGPADEVLHLGVLPDPEPGPGEVRVRLHYSGSVPATPRSGPATSVRRCPIRE